ncbi:MAG: hypothetical protein FJ276_07750 [Planctomycetes bacterium]|nr:hypothetical protein [Planctomycetota bacterium]
MSRIIVVGTGMAACGAAHRLAAAGAQSILYDRKPHCGGHTASHRFPEGFTLDEGPHVSFTTNEHVRALLAGNVQQQYGEHHARVNNYWQGHWIRHPAQCNLYGLPHDLVVNVITDLVKAREPRESKIENFEQWLRAKFGDTFAETFPMKYTRKYHTTAAANLTTEWVGPRLYQADLEEVLRGALTADTSDLHYITSFRYPNQGGFFSYLPPFYEKATVKLNHELIRIRPRTRQLHFQNGATDTYDHLISSVPLPVLIPLIEGAPRDVLEAARRLACSEAVIVSVGVGRPDPIDAHWTYFYDEDIFFTRLSTPHLQSPSNVPDGCACLMAECYYSDKYRPLDRRPEDCIEPVIRDLKKCGILLDEDRIVFRHAMHLKYANIIFDHDRKAALDVVHGFLDDIGVRTCGRYGLWGYLWTDQAFLSGENAAERVLRDGTGAARRPENELGARAT